MKNQDTIPAPATTDIEPGEASAASSCSAWYWSAIHKEWNLRKNRLAPSLATVSHNAGWTTWEPNSNKQEDSGYCDTVEEAKADAFKFVVEKGFLLQPNAEL